MPRAFSFVEKRRVTAHWAPRIGQQLALPLSVLPDFAILSDLTAVNIKKIT